MNVTLRQQQNQLPNMRIKLPGCFRAAQPLKGSIWRALEGSEGSIWRALEGSEGSGGRALEGSGGRALEGSEGSGGRALEGGLWRALEGGLWRALEGGLWRALRALEGGLWRALRALEGGLWRALEVGNAHAWRASTQLTQYPVAEAVATHAMLKSSRVAAVGAQQHCCRLVTRRHEGPRFSRTQKMLNGGSWAVDPPAPRPAASSIAFARIVQACDAAMHTLCRTLGGKWPSGTALCMLGHAACTKPVQRDRHAGTWLLAVYRYTMTKFEGARRSLNFLFKRTN
ncbi:hypothetical protein VOLCADRAFT_105837 [Volvox carteri f. nagariensis]|uniref:Uncharacterized protein n=1 Tax=Volvox carteri f. nagariensis TaxID=3068 RepID=D8U3H5_VOLCA|nr:uncharacterized protein VOLCADRAFT_105837 [Volvox carteri f. nagariensis]EFJ45756.1 hypothetical protein VOLCADRAFT_105837 [Volvox carteri f. nagariensis]|eukprot:XP_002953157.1 hypothetical protein VOLCADRAFT_105837 [Volvox carteri f. nagariensis]